MLPLSSGPQTGGSRASKRSVSDTFHLPPGAVTVRSAEGLDFEANPRLRLVLQAESGGAFAFSVLTLTLQDANDNAPRFLRPHYVAFLPESRPLEGPLLQVWGVTGRWGAGLGGLCLWPAQCQQTPTFTRSKQMTWIKAPVDRSPTVWPHPSQPGDCSM